MENTNTITNNNPELSEDYAVRGFSGNNYMQSELMAAFELVEDLTNWRNPIVNARVPIAMKQVVADAIVHFTGSLPKFTERGLVLVVNAKGYYAATEHNNMANNIKLEKLGNGTIVAVTITTRQKGSWKWQDTFEFSCYAAVRRKTRPRKSSYIWVSVMQGGKQSAPQLGSAMREYPHGSWHNMPVTPSELQALALAEEVLGGKAL